MMRITKIDILFLVKSYIPILLRTSIRLSWLEILLYPITEWYLWYDAFRISAYYEASVTGQKIKLEAWLNRLYDKDRKRIFIYSPKQDTSSYISLREENMPSSYTIVAEEGRYFASALDSGAVVYKDFYVIVPISFIEAQKIEIRGIVEQYIPVGITYDVVGSDAFSLKNKNRLRAENI